MPTFTTRLFKNGNSQAVRIPQAFRLDATQVHISRMDNGDLIIRALPVDRAAALMTALEGFDDDFIQNLAEDYAQQAKL
ncbi:MAG: AbrB/MazE/SpoVT family DNA-binding domain-containing protein [Methylovulum sp.]|nr:AbrB/MazE/SpoVT family DNA-binding domain-containing protein [Methylovulum sp.]